MANRLIQEFIGALMLLVIIGLIIKLGLWSWNFLW